ncbi:4'-phosphopantetheinyl transferase family protein [Loktanella sp. S4079]|uniref:4'-phosphopantetheinyl transferase family protein n=1 Tax=Loktanella sp. S4079 TaxID=579483 RepID=UPI000A8E544D|nr:4'-phosphopantetheinyl transferase superfamily protein [Loktanella sp. S4079]
MYDDWQVALGQLRAALPTCRVAMRSADCAGGARERRAAQHDAGRRAAAAAGMDLTGMSCLAGRGADGAPEWPNGLCGSISHCGGCSVAMVGALAHWSGLGIDIEQHLNTDIAAEIAPVALTQSEQDEFGCDPLQVALAFSAKESLFKALNPLIKKRFDFDAAELCWAGGCEPQLRLVYDLSPEWSAGRTIQPILIPCRAGVLTAVALSA